MRASVDVSQAQRPRIDAKIEDLKNHPNHAVIIEDFVAMYDAYGVCCCCFHCCLFVCLCVCVCVCCVVLCCVLCVLDVYGTGSKVNDLIFTVYACRDGSVQKFFILNVCTDPKVRSAQLLHQHVEDTRR